MGNKAILTKGLGINGCTAKDRKNKAKIDKVRGWSEVEKKLKENKCEGKERQVEVEERNRVENSGKKMRRGGGRAAGLREWQRGSFELEREEKGLWEGRGTL